MILGLAIGQWFTLISGILSFPDKILPFIKMLQTTPEQQHDAIIAEIQKQADAYKTTGRPTAG